MDELLESYVNGNISFVCSELQNGVYSFAELYGEYVELYNPSKDDLQLFVNRLS